MKNYIIGILSIAVIILGLLFFLERKKKSEVVEVPVKIEVPVPVYVGDTIIQKSKPVVIKQIDTFFYNKYQELKDSVKKDSIVKDALTIREYKEQLDDENVTINVTSNVTGRLNTQKIEYKTKEKTVMIDTTLQVQTPYKNNFGARVEVGFLSGSIINKLNLEYDMKKWGLSVGIDTETRKWVGLKYNF